jgi:serine protease Do
VTPDVAEAMGLADAKGALVTDVPDGPAKEAGIQSGDVITRFGTNDVSSAGDLTRRVADAPIGEAVPVIVLREGRTETLAVTLGRREDAEAETMPASSPAPEAPKELETLGLTLAPLDDDMRARLGLDPSTEGLMIMKVDQASEAFTKGLVEGDLITEAGQQKVVRLQDLEDMIEQAKAAGRKSILLLVRRGGDPRFVALSIEE